ncbi:spermine synthase [Arenimonas sp.]|uniref:spermine/spermidine synthase domain-containing protein n=1 Tax=Arenimonas sp. TaxID=1872635 RepID=UPI002E2EC3D2|nr:spermine synthase [Arenimonas sp.]HEX4853459.1 spermine synthase [Arenimonas sp.]
MASRFGGLERALLALFVASGFAGLIYQAIWSHYLGLSLGHAAYAQTLVLAIFMGGMALGAWIVSKRSVRWPRLIFAYAVVEIVVGLAGLAFHPLFLGYTVFSQDSVYPALESVAAVRAWQWGSAAMLIAPQSILLGMTFPLMSGGYLRVAPKADGEILGGLYFTNSIGAAFGALFATFVLLPWVGMPGAVVVAGLVNLAVGVLAWVVSRRADAQPVAVEAVVPKPGAVAAPGVGRGFYTMMLAAAAITGASSFVYEIGWVRLLNQALGTTVHSFELMLAAFILGLAFGGLWIRKRSQAIRDAVAYAGYAQVWMGIAALVSIPVFSQSFRWVGAMIGALPKTEAGYALFSLGSGGIALLVMFPAAFFAGMTLPLFTMALLRRGAGEASIGRIYAANTLGAILGVVLAVHVLIPVLGLRLAVTLAAVADILLGLVLLRKFAEGVPARRMLSVTAAGMVVVVLSLGMGQLDPRSLASGVFRHGNASLDQDDEVHYLRDGKTASVSFVSRGTIGIIATNGKPDASIEMQRGGQPTADEITMAMAAALPLALHPSPDEIAVIGWGSGLTTHTLLGSPAPKRIDSIEIEQAMVDGARNFGSRVVRAYQDERSQVHIDDARTYFSTGQRQYDIIISEPSNPWVSGVSSLFTREFYGFLRSHLKDDGIAIQWLQSYELDERLLATMVAALVAEFKHVDVYTTNGADLLFVLADKPIPPLDYSRLESPSLQSELVRLGLTSVSDFKVRQVGTLATLQSLVALYDGVPHSDYHPVVALEAPRTRFVGSSVQFFNLLARAGMPLLELTGGREPVGLDAQVDRTTNGAGASDHWIARSVHEAMSTGNLEPIRQSEVSVAKHVESLRRLSAQPLEPGQVDEWLMSAAVVADYSIGYLPAADQQGIWIAPVWIDVAAQPAPVREVMTAFAAAAARDGDAMEQAGLAALAALPSSRPAGIREQMLVIAMLGAIADGRPADAVAIERAHGADVSPGAVYGLGRAYLMAWSDVVAGK